MKNLSNRINKLPKHSIDYIKVSLKRGSLELATSEPFSGFRRFILTKFPNTKQMFVLKHTPEQGEDIYVILINSNAIIYVEIDKFNRNIITLLNSSDIHHYLQKLNHRGRIRLQIAIELID